jgi:hypothetical protein
MRKALGITLAVALAGGFAAGVVSPVVRAFGAEVIPPEKCFLDTVKGATMDSGTAYYVKETCLRQYIAALEPAAKVLRWNLHAVNWLAYYQPKVDATPRPFHEKIRVTVVNSIDYRLIAIEVFITNKATKVEHHYKLYPDTGVVEPGTTGTFEGESAEGQTDPNQVFREGDFVVAKLIGVPESANKGAVE